MNALLVDRLEVLRGVATRQADGSSRWEYTVAAEDVPCRAQPIREDVRTAGLAIEVRWVYRVYLSASVSLAATDHVRLGDETYCIVSIDRPREAGRPMVATVEQLLDLE